MYTLREFHGMMRDSARVGAYAAALKDAVSPSSIVLDLGAGTGMFSLLACAFGAKKVYAVEGAAAVHHLKLLAKENGFSDRIQIFHGDSNKITLPERANLLVTDLRGSLPFLGDNMDTLVDARSRHLTPDALIVPKEDVVRAVVVSAPAVYESLTGEFPVPAPPSFRSFFEATLNTLHVTRSNEIVASDVVSDAHELFRIDYRTCVPGVAHGIATLAVVRPGLAHGVCLYFDAHTSDAHMFSTAPGTSCVYGRSFLPWTTPVPLEEGDEIRIEVWATPAKGAYVWSWNTDVQRQGESVARFRQSTFLSEPFDLRALTAGKRT